MQKIPLTILAILLCTAAFALPPDATSHASQAQYIQSEVRQMTLWEQAKFYTKTNLLPLSVGTFTSNNIFDKDWLIGETMHVRMDETTYNVQCNAAKFVLEFYKDGNFVKAYSTNHWRVQGNIYLTGTLAIPTKDLGAGNFEVVDYLLCADADWKTKNPELLSNVISKASVQTFQIRESTAGCTAPDGEVGAPHCEDNALVQDVRKSCELSPKLIQKCAQACNAGQCVTFEEQGGTPAPEPKDKDGDGVIDNEDYPVYPEQPLWPYVVGLAGLFVIGYGVMQGGKR